MNLYCIRCTRDALERLPPNARVADFSCATCKATYQLKSKDGRFGNLLIGAAYEPTIAAVRAGEMPEYILVESDTRRSMIVYADALPGALIDETRIIARRPLSVTARRAGWRGCNIDISGLPTVAIVQPAETDRATARSQWHSLSQSIQDLREL
jgi:type II restriction enzyme